MMIAMMPKAKGKSASDSGRQLRFQPFKAAELKKWAKQLRAFAAEMEATLQIAETRGITDITIDGGTMFEKHIELLRRATGRASGFVRSQSIGED